MIALTLMCSCEITLLRWAAMQMHLQKWHLSNNTSLNSVSRHSGNHRCGCWNRCHQGPVLWQIPGHEQERQALCISKFFWSLAPAWHFLWGALISYKSTFPEKSNVTRGFCLEFLRATNQYNLKSVGEKKAVFLPSYCLDSHRYVGCQNCAYFIWILDAGKGMSDKEWAHKRLSIDATGEHPPDGSLFAQSFWLGRGRICRY